MNCSREELFLMPVRHFISASDVSDFIKGNRQNIFKRRGRGGSTAEQTRDHPFSMYAKISEFLTPSLPP